MKNDQTNLLTSNATLKYTIMLFLLKLVCHVFSNYGFEINTFKTY